MKARQPKVPQRQTLRKPNVFRAAEARKDICHDPKEGEAFLKLLKEWREDHTERPRPNLG